MLRGLEHFCYGDRLRVGVVSSGKEKALERFTAASCYLKGPQERCWGDFVRECHDKTRGNSGGEI